MPGKITTIKARQKPWSGLLSFPYGLSHLSGLCLDLIFPPRCTGCGLPDTLWCTDCQGELNSHAIIPYLRAINPHLSVASTGLYTGKLRDAIHALKYNHAPHLAAPLASRLDALLATLPYSFDCLIPVPIHTARLQQRGYNQAKLLADQIKNLTGIPVMDSVIVRHQNTRTQVGLTAQKRRENVAGAFTTEGSLEGKQVLLIDDVLTTGATLAACAQTAYDAGASFVFGLTASHARDLASC